MSGLISYSELQQSAPLPVAIDYPAALALRQMALIQGKLPKYLLAPEVSALHHYVPDLHRRMLLATLLIFVLNPKPDVTPISNSSFILTLNAASGWNLKY